MEKGAVCFTEEQLKKYSDRYDEILQKSWEEHKQTKGMYTRKEQKKLLNRLKKYKGNHLLFLYNFKVPFSYNISKRDFRKCKNRQKNVRRTPKNGWDEDVLHDHGIHRNSKTERIEYLSKYICIIWRQVSHWLTDLFNVFIFLPG